MNEARYIISAETHRNQATAVISSLPLDPPYEVQIKPYKKTRSGQQNRYLWGVVLTQIAANIPDEDGVLHEPYWWHHKLKIHFGYVNDTMPMQLDGKTVDVPWPRTSTKFSVAEMQEYIEQCLMFASERGVLIDG